MNGLPYLALARLHSDGSLDTTFPSILRPDEDDDPVVVRSIVIQDGMRAVLGGERLLTPEASEARGLLRVHLGEPSPRLALRRIGHTVRLSFSTPSGFDYEVLRSTNLNLLTTDWTVLGPATNVGADVYQFTDDLTPSDAHCFYRLHRSAPRLP